MFLCLLASVQRPGQVLQAGDFAEFFQPKLMCNVLIEDALAHVTFHWVWKSACQVNYKNFLLAAAPGKRGHQKLSSKEVFSPACIHMCPM